MATVFQPGGTWGRGAEEESDNGSQQSFDRVQQAAPPLDYSPQHPEAPDIGKDDSQLLYASVSQEHVQMKR